SGFNSRLRSTYISAFLTLPIMLRLLQLLRFNASIQQLSAACCLQEPYFCFASHPASRSISDAASLSANGCIIGGLPSVMALAISSCDSLLPTCCRLDFCPMFPLKSVA